MRELGGQRGEGANFQENKTTRGGKAEAWILHENKVTLLLPAKTPNQFASLQSNLKLTEIDFKNYALCMR